jgi:TldD protein
MSRPVAVCAAALVVIGAGAWCAQPPAPSPLLRAMSDELSRARTLALAGLEKPYFVAYRVEETDGFAVSATLGGVTLRRRNRIREPQVEIRVGSYQFDNSNFPGVGAGGRYDLGRFPIEDSYTSERRYLWLQTDAAYKAAVESIARKRATLRNLTPDQINDFAQAPPVRHVSAVRPLTIDEDQWSDRVRRLSAIFAGYPGIRDSSVQLEASESATYLVNTEGTEVQAPESAAMVRALAVAQAPDGMYVRDTATFLATTATGLPGEAELTRRTQEVAENVAALVKAPRGEDYNGPVLFAGEAAAQVFAELLGRNLTVTRRPAGTVARAGSVSEFEGRKGARVLPEFFTVVDDPGQTEWRGRPLFGSYEVDREGVVPKPVRLVEKGVLKDYFLTRQPVRGYEGSNGRARLPGSFGASLAAPSNLFVTASETVATAELKQKLIELCRERGKPYGILVRKMDFPSTAPNEELRRTLNGTTRPVSSPLLVYRVFTDGREELIRGVQFRAFTGRSLKDILAAGADSNVFEYMENGVALALAGGSSFSTEVSVVAPSILIDDLELHANDDDLPKLPVIPAPEMAR